MSANDRSAVPDVHLIPGADGEFFASRSGSRGSSKPCWVAMTASGETLTARRSRSWGVAGMLSFGQQP
jgi:hypothetical protein